MYLTVGDKIWRSLAAGLCGNAAHSGVMYLKRWMGWLPTFHPYRDLQHGLSEWLGGAVHPSVPQARSAFRHPRPGEHDRAARGLDHAMKLVYHRRRSVEL